MAATKSTGRWLVLVLGLVVTVVTTHALADTKSDNGGNNPTWKTKSAHSGSHYIDLCEGKESLSARVHGYSSGLVVDQLKATKTTPLSGTMTISAEGHGPHSSYGYSVFAKGSDPWVASNVIGGEGTITTSFGTSNHTYKTTAAHTISRYRMIMAVANIPTTPGPWGSTYAMVTDFEEGGALPVDEFGDYVWSYDENGDLVLAEAQVVALRLTSTVAHPYGGTVVYTYNIENFTDLDRDFVFPDIRTPGYTTGWSGTVSANDSVGISNTVSNQNVWVQCSQGDTCISDDTPSVNCRPVTVYVPQNQTAFVGQTNLVSATRSPSTAAISVVFQVTAAATEAHLMRTVAGVTTEVASSDSAMAPFTNYTLVDPIGPGGEVSYYVTAGVRVNGAASEEELVAAQ